MLFVRLAVDVLSRSRTENGAASISVLRVLYSSSFTYSTYSHSEFQIIGCFYSESLCTFSTFEITISELASRSCHATIAVSSVLVNNISTMQNCKNYNGFYVDNSMKISTIGTIKTMIFQYGMLTAHCSRRPTHSLTHCGGGGLRPAASSQQPRRHRIRCSLRNAGATTRRRTDY